MNKSKYTGQEIYGYILLNWNKKTTKDIATHLGIYEEAVRRIAGILRIKGFPLINKSRTRKIDYDRLKLLDQKEPK